MGLLGGAGRVFQAGVNFAVFGGPTLVRNAVRINSAVKEVRKSIDALEKGRVRTIRKLSASMRDASVSAKNFQSVWSKIGKSSTKAGAVTAKSVATVSKSARRAGKNVAAVGGMAGAAFILANTQVRQLGQNLFSMGRRGFQALKRISDQFISLGGQFQQSRIIFKQVFGLAGPREFNRALAEAERTSLDTTLILSQVPNFGRQGVDVLKQFPVILKEGNTVMESGLQLLNDLITGTGQQADIVFQNFNKAIAGSNRNFRALFDGREKAISKSTGKSFADMFKLAKSAGDRAEVVFTAITETGLGGISALTQETFMFITQNIGDVLRNIAGLIGERLLAPITKPLIELKKALSAVKDNADVMNGLAIAFEFIGERLGFLIRVAAKAIRFFTFMAKQSPALLKLGVTLTFLAPIALMVAGLFTSFAGIVAAFVTFVLPSLVVGLKIAAGAFLLIGVPLIGFIVSLKPLLVLVERNYAGIATKLKQLGQVFMGLFTIIKNYKDGITSMSVTTRDSLQDIGVLDFVLELGGYLGSIKQLVFDVFSFISSSQGGFEKAMLPIFVAFERLVGTVGKQLGEIFIRLFGDATDTLDGTVASTSRFEKIFDRVMSVVVVVAQRIADVIDIVRVSMEENNTLVVNFFVALKAAAIFTIATLVGLQRSFVAIATSGAAVALFKIFVNLREIVLELVKTAGEFFLLFVQIAGVFGAITGETPMGRMFKEATEQGDLFNLTLAIMTVSLRNVANNLTVMKIQMRIFRISTAQMVGGLTAVFDILKFKINLARTAVRDAVRSLTNFFFPLLVVLLQIFNVLSDVVDVAGDLAEVITPGIAALIPGAALFTGGGIGAPPTVSRAQLEEETAITPAASGGAQKIEAKLKEGQGLLDASERNARATEELRDLIADRGATPQPFSFGDVLGFGQAGAGE